MIIGSGSASFEMLRALVLRLPAMVCPRWVSNRTQPIAIRSVLAYLIGCLENPETAGQVLDIGGPDVLTYKQMMERFAAIVGKKRWILVVPVLTPRLSAYWANLVTPVPASVAFPLIEGLKSETVCEDDRIRTMVPVELIGFDEAVRLSLAKIKRDEVETRWTNASLPRPDRSRVPFDRGRLPDPRRAARRLRGAAPDVLFDRVRRVGGEVGWYYADSLWKVRGWMDRLIGGVGLRRGRRDPVRILVGDAIDFWRVEDIVPGERLLLHAEMKVPGDAWLEFRVDPLDGGRSELIQTAYFRPSPFWGRLYWDAALPAPLVHLPRHGPRHRPGRRARASPRRPFRRRHGCDGSGLADARSKGGADDGTRLPRAGGDRRDRVGGVLVARRPGRQRPRRRARPREARTPRAPDTA